MAQQINLYPQSRERRRRVFSRVGSTIVVVLFVAAVGIWSLVEDRRLAALREDVRRTAAEAERLQRLLAQVPSPAASLAERVAAEDRSVTALEQVAVRLTAGSLGTSDGFSARLRAFAQAPVDGVWLTQIRISQADGGLSVEGRALDAALVPAWIGGLKRVPLLAQTTFAAIDLRAAEDRAPGSTQVQFRLTSAPQPGAGSGAAVAAGAAALAGAR